MYKPDKKNEAKWLGVTAVVIAKLKSVKWIGSNREKPNIAIAILQNEHSDRATKITSYLGVPLIFSPSVEREGWKMPHMFFHLLIWYH